MIDRNPSFSKLSLTFRVVYLSYFPLYLLFGSRDVGYGILVDITVI